MLWASRNGDVVVAGEFREEEERIIDGDQSVVGAVGRAGDID